MIRQRISAAAQSISDAVALDDSHDHDPRFTTGLTAPHLLRASPQHEGPVLKLHTSVFYSFLPQVLQSLILNMAWLAALLAPKWERRHLILLGSFLYKFSDNVHPTRGPKGSSIPLQTLSMAIVSLQALQQNVGIVSFPAGYTTVICLSTIRTRQYYLVHSREIASEWMQTLELARQEAITRSMGHALPESFPKSWNYYDSLGANFVKKKERIRTMIDSRNLQEIEMSRLNDAGPMPNGYFS
ncbi:hypothetical protein MPSEU_000656900 [Mayamaea pseudoterrestris]|nr:hypothetical protein MPSEU_000656900 [Mayamaea pseudoterrestris]